MKEGVRRIADASRGKVGHYASTGMVGAVQFTRPGTTTPLPELAWEVVNRAVERGLLLFAPVGVGGGAVKLNPPLTITKDALLEGLGVLENVAEEL
jgi:4-aminobutyrate aminotransferase-like enzyme